MVEKIILGTRGSELARTQTLLVEKAIRAVHSSVTIETKIIATRGDIAKVIESRAGRKGVFTAEIERGLLAGDVDVAVHSAKDLPSETSPGTEIAAAPPRGPRGDVLVSRHRGGRASRPPGSTAAIGSVLWSHQLPLTRADLHPVAL